MNREKIIKGLECCTFILGKRKCNECPYQKGLPDNGCYQLQDDFHAILKEQEAKYGYWINPTSQDCHCSECGEQPVHEPGESVPLYDYCPYCGAKMEVKWNEID